MGRYTNKTLLFRLNQDNEEEYRVAKKIFGVQTNRTHCLESLVIGRYSVLPYYKELEEDLSTLDSTLINSYSQHRYIANFDYYEDLKDYTFETWFDLREIPDFTRFVVKGRTNSRKFQWDKLMYAKDRTRAIEIAHELMGDPLIGDQGVIVRRFEDLELIEEGINGIKFVNEHRIFYYNDKRLASGYYWTSLGRSNETPIEALVFADDVAKIVSQHTNFFVLDVAKNCNGKWRLVEVNDGQMSGLSYCNPYELYVNLKDALDTDPSLP